MCGRCSALIYRSDEKAGLIFDVCDSQQTGSLSGPQLEELVTIIWDWRQRQAGAEGGHRSAAAQAARGNDDSDSGAPALDVGRFVADMLATASGSAPPSSTGAGSLSPARASLPRPDFLRWAMQHSEPIDIAQALELVARVELGARPSSLAAEAHVIQSCVTLFLPSRPGREGAAWYLVPMGWWQRWIKASGFRLPRHLRDEEKAETAALESRGLSPLHSCPHPFPDSRVGASSADDAMLEAVDVTAGRDGVGPIDCTPLVAETHFTSGGSFGELKSTLQRNLDFVIVNESVWNALSTWYGMTRIVLKREVVYTGAVERATESTAKRGADAVSKQGVWARLTGKTATRKKRVRPATVPSGPRTAPEADRLELELYPIVLWVRRVTSDGGITARPSVAVFSRTQSLLQVQQRLCKMYFLPEDPDRSRLWWQEGAPDGAVENAYEPLPDKHLTLEQTEVASGDDVLIETQADDRTWPRLGFEVDVGGKGSDGRAGLVAAPRSRQGIVGLHNLGNTCYLNSATQCLVHSPLINEYFLSGEHLYDVNVHASLGTRGQLAVVFGQLVQEILQTSHAAIAPRRLKQAISEANGLFSGYDQHDAQEYLDTLLATLDEDLNRIANKPYIEHPDSKGRPDDVVAREWWFNYLQRQQSILSLFTGQFRSTLRCLNCGYESCRYEVFHTLQLPLPEPEHRFIRVTLHFRHGARRPMMLSVKVPKAGTIRDLAAAIEAAKPGMWVPSPSKPQGADAQDVEVVREIPSTPRIRIIAEELLICNPDPMLFGGAQSIYAADTPLSRISELTRLVAMQYALPSELIPERPPRVVRGTCVLVRDRRGPMPGVIAAITKAAPEAQSKTAAETPSETAAGSAAQDAMAEAASPVRPRADLRYHVSALGHSFGQWLGLQRDQFQVYSPAAVPLVCVHRRVWKSDWGGGFDNVRREVFGSAFVLPFRVHRQSMLELYQAVWKCTKRFIRRPSHPNGGFIVTQSPSASEHEATTPSSPGPASQVDEPDSDDSQAEPETVTRPIVHRAQPTLEELTDVMNRWGFCLRLTTKDGISSPGADWRSDCGGALLMPADDPPAIPLRLAPYSVVAIDWDPVRGTHAPSHVYNVMSTLTPYRYVCIG